jgi:hypothetical protein
LGDKDPQDQRDSKEHKEIHHKVLRVLKVTRQKVLKVIEVIHHKDHKDLQDLKGLEDHKVVLVTRVQGRLDQQEILQQGHKDHKVMRTQDQLVLLVLQVVVDQQD